MNEFVASVAKVYGLDTSDNLVFEGKTLIDSSISKAINSTDVHQLKQEQPQQERKLN